MLKSMTGYGKAVCEVENARYTIEIKSLNSKQLDFNLRIPLVFREKEIEIRNAINQQLSRGKVDLYIDHEPIEEEAKAHINRKIVKEYYEQLKDISYELKIQNDEQFLQIVMRLPDILKREKDELKETVWETVREAIQKAIAEVSAFREREGAALEKDILKRVGLIETKLQEITPFEKQRLESIRMRMDKNLTDIINGDHSVDKDRFEQEMIYYLERLDITEEKVRLANHCKYFRETLKENTPGKKLGFISQEMLREINTIGSKASEAAIQQIVVEMKDELEKIKEQLMNVL
jgi:uncharacterized protein (TIGR00255 family)